MNSQGSEQYRFAHRMLAMLLVMSGAGFFTARAESATAESPTGAQSSSPSVSMVSAEDRLIAYQSPVAMGRLFGRDSNRSGLQSTGSISVSVEAIFGDVDDSSGLIGSPDAPQIFGTQFFAASLSAIDGAQVGLDTFDQAAIGQQIVNEATLGVKGRAIYRAANNGTLEVNGFLLGESKRSWQRGVGGYDAGANPDTVRATAALPLSDGLGGFAVPFDQFFKFGLTSNIYGLGADVAPVGYRWGALLLQPTIGVKYINMDEAFAFRGADSGLSYTLESTGVPNETEPSVSFPPYQSFLDVTTDNQLIGPALGLNFSTSGHLVRFGATTRVGGFFGESSQTLSGQGFGNGFAEGFDPSIVFSDSQTLNYGTPFYEQTLNLDIELLRLLPRTARFQGNNSLVLRLGWSFMAIARVMRPVESVVWDGFPRTPTLKKSNEEWNLQTWNIGLVFQY